MRKKLLYLALAIALISTFVVPTPVLADSPKATTHTFSAIAQAYVTDPGKVIALGTRIITRGEIIEGTVVATDWQAINGASVRVKHFSEINLVPNSPFTGTFSGEAKAVLDVKPVGGGQLNGTYRANLYGEYIIIDGQLVVTWVNDSGTIEATGIVGSEVVKVDGTWNANLVLTLVGPGVYTLAGLAQMGGQYQTVAITGKK